MRGVLRARSRAWLVVPTALATSGCALAADEAPACTLEMRTYHVTMERTLDVRAADVDRHAIGLTVDGQSGSLDADRAGSATVDLQPRVAVAAADDGRAVVKLVLVVTEHTRPMTVELRVRDADGRPTTVSGQLAFHPADERGCHYEPDAKTF